MHNVILTQPQYNGTVETTKPLLQNPYYLTTLKTNRRRGTFYMPYKVRFYLFNYFSIILFKIR